MIDHSPTNSRNAGDLSEKRNTSQFVGFEVGGQEYAFPIEKIQEIVIRIRVTPTPHVADFVEGVSNLRGAIIPIINLRNLFGLEPKPADAETSTIVVNVGERTIGCTVDRVSQVIRVSAENVQAAPESVTAEGADYLWGFAKLDNRLVILLDVAALLAPDKLSRLSKSAIARSAARLPHSLPERTGIR